MTIGIDARMYQEGLGIGRYIEKILNHLGELDSSNSFVIFLTKKNWDRFTPPNKRFRKVCADIHWYGIAEQLFLPLLIAREHIDCMHFPHFNVPLFFRGKYVVTIHDLILMKHPQSSTVAASTRSGFFHALKYKGYTCILRHAVRHAQAIIAVSQSVKNDIVSYLGVSQKKIAVIYEAAELTVSDTPCALGAELFEHPYFFYAGNAYPHKNIPILLEAFRNVHARNTDVRLLLCGQEDYFQKRIVLLIHVMGLERSVFHLGRLSDACLKKMYTNAIAFVFPSREEGFGLPGVEAWLYGCPVIASDIPVFREIYGDAALYADTNTNEGLASAMNTMAQSKELQKEYRTRGKVRAARYSWNQAAEQTLALYDTLGVK